MQKALRIKIREVSFNVEESAVPILESYLNSVRQHFMVFKDGEEIIEDIETRIAEKASKALKNKDDILAKEQVENLVEEMGSVKEMQADEQPEEKLSLTEKIKFKLENFKLLRDTQNQQVAGVCAGLGIYFGIDPVVIRLIFGILLIIGLFTEIQITWATLAVYTILWIAMPEAKTAVQRLEMKGESVTVGNIEKESKQVKEKNENAIVGAASIFETIFGVIGKIIKKSFEFGVRLFGAFVVVGGLGAILGIFIWLFMTMIDPGSRLLPLNMFHLQGFPNYYVSLLLGCLAGFTISLITIELGVAMFLMKNIIKVLPTVFLVAIAIISTALFFTLMIHDVNVLNGNISGLVLGFM